MLLGARRLGGTARIEIRDTGPGIPQDDQDAIFEEFRRLDGSAGTSDGPGSGLAIVERACARLGHPLGLWSEPGRGSCFMLNMPVAGHARTGADTARRSARPAGLALAGLIALLVENDPKMRRAMSVLMKSWGVSVIEAEDAPTALSLLEDPRSAPTRVCSTSSGATAFGRRALRGDRCAAGRPALPCAIVSADRSAQLRQACRDRSLSFPIKPIDRHKLGGFLDSVAARMV